MSVIMSGKDVANQIKKEVKQKVEELKKQHMTPRAGIIRVGEMQDSIGYERSATRVLSQLGIEIKSFHFTEEISEDDFVDEFEKINQDANIHGILLLRPLPQHIDEDEISRRIHPEKDIDGMSPYNIGKVLLKEVILYLVHPLPS